MELINREPFNREIHTKIYFTENYRKNGHLKVDSLRELFNRVTFTEIYFTKDYLKENY